MSRLVAAVARVGDAADSVVTSVAALPGRVRAALAVRLHRWAGIIAAIVALVLYLLAIGDLAIGAGVRTASWLEAAPNWTDRLFQARAPYLFEPVLAIHAPQVTLLLSPVNLILGALLAALVGLNLALAGHTTSCRRTRYGRLLAALPALLTGMACCVPTILTVLGTGSTALLLPVLLPLRAVFYPLSLLLLTATLVWGTRFSATSRA